MSKNQKQERVTKIGTARAIFNRHLNRLGDKPYSKSFRQDVLADFEKETGCEVPSAASMYNQCKVDAEAQGLIVRGRLGRMPAKSVPVNEETPWLIFYNREVEPAEEGGEATTVQIALGQAETKKAATELAAPVEGAQVTKTSEFLDANPDTPRVQPEAEAEAEGEGESTES